MKNISASIALFVVLISVAIAMIASAQTVPTPKQQVAGQVNLALGEMAKLLVTIQTREAMNATAVMGMRTQLTQMTAELQSLQNADLADPAARAKVVATLNTVTLRLSGMQNQLASIESWRLQAADGIGKLRDVFSQLVPLLSAYFAAA